VVCRNIRLTTQHGAIEEKTQEKVVKHYNLDVIFFVGYLDRIRDIRSSEKVMYRQVLDLYATARVYNPKSGRI